MSDFFYDDAEAEEQHEDGIYGDEQDYGSCPICGSHGEMINEGRKHWIVCHEDKVKWRVGTGLFSFFHRDKSSSWDRPRELLASYREVKPLMDGDEVESPAEDDNSDIARLKRMFE